MIFRYRFLSIDYARSTCTAVVLNNSCASGLERKFADIAGMCLIDNIEG